MARNCRLSLILVILVFVLACFAQAGFSSSWPQLAVEDAKNIMPVSQVKRGMEGYGLTVFQGTKIEKFDVEVLGVLKQMNLGKDLILVRIGGGPITSRSTGIIGGMSGSPVYVNGKLVGAVAYGAQFAKEPVGMLTPIGDMLEAWDSNLPKDASGHSSPGSLSQAVSVDGKAVQKVIIDPIGGPRTGVANGVLHMQPLMTPLMVSGVSQRGIARLAEVLEPFHLQPMAGPGAAPERDAGADLAPGAAVGMSLATGDIDMTGIGTLTYRRGDKVVAFGHPMLGLGAIDAPMTTAYVDDVISSYQVSTKMASPIKTIGRIFQDRPWCVAGRLGEMPETIPVTVSVNDESTRRSRTYKINVMNHPLLASRILTMIVGEAIYEMHPTPGDATAEVNYEVNADQVGKITRRNVFFDPVSVDLAAIRDVGTLLQLLSSNPFYPLDIKSLNMNVRIVDKRNTATIDRIFVKESEYEPGEKVEVGVVLRPYKKDRVTKTFSVKIPATAADGKVILQVRGGASAGLPIGMMASVVEDEQDGPGGTGSSLANVDNVNQLIDKYLEREKNNEIVVQLLMRSTTVNVAGEKLTGLPTAIADVMKSSRNSGLKMERDEVKEVFAEDMIVNGAARLTINVKKKDLNEGKRPSKSESSSSDDETDSSPSTISTDQGVIIYGSGGGDLNIHAAADSAAVDVSEDAAVDESEDSASSEPESETGSEETSSSAPTTKVTTLADVKTVVRQAKSWMQKTQADFAKGTFSGVSASSDDKLQLVPTLKKLVETPEQFAWCLAPAKDGVYAGTGNSGKIYHVSDSGEISVFYDTQELEVHSLVRDSSGNLYAGTSPDGKVFKISPDGQGKLLYKTPEHYVLALAMDGEGNLYAGVGDAGKVYRITPTGIARELAELDEQQVLSLDWDPSGSLLVGTGINGVVYRVDGYGLPRPIFDAPESSITSVVADSDGNVYAGTSPKGKVYKVSPDGRSKDVFSKSTARVLSMARDKDNNIYAVSDGTLAKIAPDETVITLDSSKDKVQFLSLTFNESTGALYAGTGNIGSIYISKCCELTGTFESPVHDTEMMSRWGRIKWVADVPEGGGVEIRTRTGNVETPDATWMPWSDPYTNASGERILSSPARYIQYQVTLKAGKSGESPKVSTVALSYLTPNQAPTVKLRAPVGGEVWSGKETIKWTGSDPDKDKLTYDVYYSKDGGKHWTALVGGVSGSDSGGKSAKEIVDKVESELEKSPDVPEEMKEKVLAEPEKGSTSNGTADSRSAKSSTSTSYSWNTKDVEDGPYVIKIVASDKTSNATDVLTEEAVSEPFVVCNTAPKLTLYKKGVETKAKASATVNGSARSDLVEIAGVQYRLDGGDWAAAAPADGMFDSPYESFTVTTDGLSAGTHKLEVQAIDAAGNASSGTVEVKVS